jgi:3',5'-cyclic-AMP phosphodiesterase
LLSPVTRGRSLAHFGPDSWSLQVPGWRILAINDLLLGSNLAGGEQIRFIRQLAATADGVVLALFTHRPLFHTSPHEQDIAGRFLNLGARAELLAAWAGSGRR